MVCVVPIGIELLPPTMTHGSEGSKTVGATIERWLEFAAQIKYSEVPLTGEFRMAARY